MLSTTQARLQGGHKWVFADWHKARSAAAFSISAKLDVICRMSVKGAMKYRLVELDRHAVGILDGARLSRPAHSLGNPD